MKKKEQNEKVEQEIMSEEKELRDVASELEEDIVEIETTVVEEVSPEETTEPGGLAKEYLDKLQRTMAEYDNFRKRTIKEKSQMYENGAKEVFEKIIPIVDNFERALSSITEEEKGSSFGQGIEMIYKQLIGTLNNLGVEEMNALHQTFDPNLHHAVSHEDDDTYGVNEVVEVFQKGYMYKERVLRFGMVKVAN